MLSYELSYTTAVTYTMQTMQTRCDTINSLSRCRDVTMHTDAEQHYLPRNGNESGVFVQKPLVIHLHVHITSICCMVLHTASKHNRQNLPMPFTWLQSNARHCTVCLAAALHHCIQSRQILHQAHYKDTAYMLYASSKHRHGRKGGREQLERMPDGSRQQWMQQWIAVRARPLGEAGMPGVPGGRPWHLGRPTAWQTLARLSHWLGAQSHPSDQTEWTAATRWADVKPHCQQLEAKVGTLPARAFGRTNAGQKGLDVVDVYGIIPVRGRLVQA